MKLYLSRHGETDINVLDRVCGLTEAMLTEKGRCQAMSLGERVKDKNIDLIISSPMKRAQETSRIASSVCGAPVITDDRLIEQNYGIYEGGQIPRGISFKQAYVCVQIPGRGINDAGSIQNVFLYR